jgi:hypothetical protein
MSSVLKCKCVIVHRGLSGCLPESSCVVGSMRAAHSYMRDDEANYSEDEDGNEWEDGCNWDCEVTTIGELAHLNGCEDAVRGMLKDDAIQYLNERVFI